METHGITQNDIAEIIGVTQAAVSKKLKPSAKWKDSQLKSIEDKYGLSEGFLKSGKNIPPNEITEVAESIESYKKSDDTIYSEANCQKRLKNQLRQFMVDFNLNQKEACKELHLPQQHVNNIINGGKPLTLSIIRNTFIYGNFDVCYTLFEKGEFFVPKNGWAFKVKSLEMEIAELKRDKQNQQRLIELLEGETTHKQTA